MQLDAVMIFEPKQGRKTAEGQNMQILLNELFEDCSVVSSPKIQI